MIEIGVIIGVIMALGQLIKGLGLPTKYVPLVNLVLGIVAGLFLTDMPTLQEQVFTGILMGVSAGGLYDQKKPVQALVSAVKKK